VAQVKEHLPCKCKALVPEEEEDKEKEEKDKKKNKKERSISNVEANITPQGNINRTLE
jgi:hypothetical protein